MILPTHWVYIQDSKQDPEEIFAHPCSKQCYSQQQRAVSHPKCSLIGEWVNKVWCIHAIGINKEGNSDTGYNMVNPEESILSEISQSQKDTYCVIPLICST